MLPTREMAATLVVPLPARACRQEAKTQIFPSVAELAKNKQPAASAAALG